MKCTKIGNLKFLSEILFASVFKDHSKFHWNNSNSNYVSYSPLPAVAVASQG